MANRKTGGRRALKWTLIIIGGGIVLFMAGKALSKGKKIEKVATEKTTKRTIIESVNASGKIYPEVEVKISPDISGEVTELNVEEGDSVKKGKILARIYADIYSLQRDEAASRVNQSSATVDNSKAALEALQAALDQAQQTYDRNKKLFEDKVISKSELEQYETTLRSAQANYTAAQQNIKSLQAGVQSTQVGLSRANKDLGRTTLIAPMDGVISSLKIKKGERVAGNSFNIGTEMMTVADMSILEVRVDVGENDIVKISIGDSADVEVDAYNNRKFKGVVTKIASSTKTSGPSLAGNEVTNYEVRIRLDKESYKDLANRTFPFRPGMNASADIKTRRVDNVLAVPIGAVTARAFENSKSGKPGEDEEEADKNISDNGLEEIVFVLQKDGTVKKTVVQTGVQDITNIEIQSGLKNGDEIIVAPYNVISKILQDGMKVKVVSKNNLFKN